MSRATMRIGRRIRRTSGLPSQSPQASFVGCMIPRPPILTVAPRLPNSSRPRPSGDLWLVDSDVDGGILRLPAECAVAGPDRPMRQPRVNGC